MAKSINKEPNQKKKNKSRPMVRVGLEDDRVIDDNIIAQKGSIVILLEWLETLGNWA
jgi:hypothetical protein